MGEAKVEPLTSEKKGGGLGEVGSRPKTSPEDVNGISERERVGMEDRMGGKNKENLLKKKKFISERGKKNRPREERAFEKKKKRMGKGKMSPKLEQKSRASRNWTEMEFRGRKGEKSIIILVSITTHGRKKGSNYRRRAQGEKTARR